MKKSNIIVTALALAVSIVLLVVWYAFGFYKSDDPLDLVVSIVWWLAIAGVIVAITRAEAKRRERMRMCFVGDGFVFNSEPGLVKSSESNSVEAMSKILNTLEYKFQNAEIPNEPATDFKYIVHTTKFSDNGRVWEGEVIAADTQKERSFANRFELQAILG